MTWGASGASGAAWGANGLRPPPLPDVVLRPKLFGIGDPWMMEAKSVEVVVLAKTSGILGLRENFHENIRENFHEIILSNL